MASTASTAWVNYSSAPIPSMSSSPPPPPPPSVELGFNGPRKKPTRITCSLQTPPKLLRPKKPLTFQPPTTAVAAPTSTSITHAKELAPPVQWNFLQKFASMALDAVENALVSHELEHPLPKTSNPQVQISGNFAPMSEQPVCHSLPVVGKDSLKDSLPLSPVPLDHIEQLMRYRIIGFAGGVEGGDGVALGLEVGDLEGGGGEEVVGEEKQGGRRSERRRNRSMADAN